MESIEIVFRYGDEPDLYCRGFIKDGSFIIEYRIESFEEPISKSMIGYVSDLMSIFPDVVFRTNAGIALHSSEIVAGTWQCLTIERL